MKFLLCALVVFVSAATALAQEWKGNCPEFPDVNERVMMCVADTLSAVDLLFQENNTGLERDRQKYEALIRSAALRHFPALRQETLGKYDAFDQFGTDPGALELKRRVALTFHVWTVGHASGFPVAYHISARMNSYGATRFDPVEDATLGYCYADGLGAVLEEAIDRLMKGMAEQFRQGIGDFEAQAGVRQ
ncbi:hypothetical protein [Desulfocurvus vexinensis]|uniref:hypothetical protein n=1 Tax=Desulfocurvus vexinensis TaxID=399548 RepID=UPI00048C2757|nr:hypothetical protein [Desulfocurvus vexinensis]